MQKIDNKKVIVRKGKKRREEQERELLTHTGSHLRYGMFFITKHRVQEPMFGKERGTYSCVVASYAKLKPCS